MVKINNQQIINNLQNNFLKKNLPIIKIGDNVKIGVKIIEGNKERVQFYEGVVLAKKIVLLIQPLQFEKYYKELGLKEFF